MKTVLRTRFLLVVLASFTFTLAKANNEKTSPYQFSISEFVKATVQFLHANPSKASNFLQKLKEKNTSRICVCEIMDLQNNNSEFSGVALFSEKTNNGDVSRDIHKAEKVMDQEKKHMKELFFDKVKVTNKITAATDCLSLYMKLNRGTGGTDGIKMYDILDADILSAIGR